MERHFAEELRDANDHGARRRFLLRVLVDVIRTAPGELARGLYQDVRHAIRVYARAPGASLTAILILAVGMAVVGASLSLYVDFVLKPVPGLDDSGSLVTIEKISDDVYLPLRFETIQRMADEVATLEAVVGVDIKPVAHEGERVTLEVASRGFAEHIRPQIALGRGFGAEAHEFEAEPVVVISDRFWAAHYDRRPDVIGETIALTTLTFWPDDSEELTEFRIIGVMSPEMRGLVRDDTDMWAPFERIVPFMMGIDADYAREIGSEDLRALGRLRSGASPAALLNELELRYSTVNSTNEYSIQLDVEPGVDGGISGQRRVKQQLEIFLAGSVLLALVATANVSLFLLARAPGRQREIAVRVAVGAPMRRVVRQLASESGLLVFVSCILGLFFSVWVASALRGTALFSVAEWKNVTLLDWRVLGLTGGFVLMLTLIVSLAPILSVKRSQVAASTRQVFARATPVQMVAGTAQIAIAGAFGGAAIAFVWFLFPMIFGDPGYEVDDRLVFSGISQQRFGGAGLEIHASRQREIIESLPSVGSVTFTLYVPGGQVGGMQRRTVFNPTDSSREIPAGFAPIDTRYVEVFGFQVRHGRAPTEGETGVSLVNQALAKALFGRDNVVGEILSFGNAPETRTQIVGVLQDVSFGHPADVVEPAIFVLQQPPIVRSVIESPLSPGEMQQELQQLYDAGDLELQPLIVTSLKETRDSDLAPDTARGLSTIATASLVILMAAFGFYGTQRYLVSAGRREYAIRASLGAGQKALGRLVFARGFTLSLPGLVLGALLTFILVSWLRDEYLFGETSPGLVTAGVVIGLALLVLAASLGPARQAMKTQPAPLLRED